MKVLVTIACLVAAAVASDLQRTVKFTRAWQECNPGSPAILKIKELSIGGNGALQIPGKFRMTLKYSIAKEVANGPGLRIKVSLKKKVLGLGVPVPCISNLGSCTYQNGCDTLKVFYEKNQRCPLSMPITCVCPLAQADDAGFVDQELMVPGGNVNGILSWLKTGSYDLRLDVSSGGELFTCIKATLKLS